MVLLNLLETIPLIAGSPQPLLSAAHLVSRLLHGFKDYPFIIWTTENELFPVLAEVLIKVSQEQGRPVELWQWTHELSRPSLKFAAGKPLYAIFPPVLAQDVRNVMLKLLDNFTTCNRDPGAIERVQMNDSIFLFLSTAGDGSQEDPSFMQKIDKDYCDTPSQLLFLKYSVWVNDETQIELESLRAVRIRCDRTDRYACTEIVSENDTLQALSYLSSKQVKNLIQVEWRKTFSTQVFMVGVSDIIKYKGKEWDNLKAIFNYRPFRVLRGRSWLYSGTIAFFELIAHVNITVEGLFAKDRDYFDLMVVGYISTSMISAVTSTGLSLRDTMHFVVIYGGDLTSRYNPLAAKGLLGACGALELFIVLGLVFLISALRMKKHHRLKDFITNVISTLAPLISQSCFSQRSRLHLLYYTWMISVWFSTTMYLSLLQSQRIAPSVQMGNETFKDLDDYQIPFHASYSVYWSLRDTQEEKPGTMSRLASIIQNEPIWKMSVDAFRNFFTLNQSAYVVDATDVEPLSKVLTKAYSKNYQTLPENIYPQLEWSVISIPQGEYVFECFKRIKESGIWDYWYLIHQFNRKLDVELSFQSKLEGHDMYQDPPDKYKHWNISDSVLLEMRFGFPSKLEGQEIYRGTADKFVPLSVSDSLLLEMTTLCGLILSALIVMRFGPILWFTLLKIWVGCKVKKFMRWLYTAW